MALPHLEMQDSAEGSLFALDPASSSQAAFDSQSSLSGSSGTHLPDAAQGSCETGVRSGLPIPNIHRSQDGLCQCMFSGGPQPSEPFHCHETVQDADGPAGLSGASSGVWFTPVDLESAYWYVLIHPCFHKFLMVQVGRDVFQFTVLPFGLKITPWVFTKLTKEMVQRLAALNDD